jgi:hypothetical protein
MALAELLSRFPLNRALDRWTIDARVRDGSPGCGHGRGPSDGRVPCGRDRHPSSLRRIAVHRDEVPPTGSLRTRGGSSIRCATYSGGPLDTSSP